jgi:hypothetical protein
MIQRARNFAWDGTYLLRGIFDLVKWPLERAAWAVERRVIWPLAERTGGWATPVRGVAIGSCALLAAAALTFGAMRAGDAGPGEEAAPIAAAPASAPVETAKPVPAPKPAEPVLQGAEPDFTPSPDDSQAKVATADTVVSSDPDTPAESTASSASAGSTSAETDGKAAETEVKDPGPAAIEVARRFSGAFVLYETGSTDAEVRKAFAATATPQLTKALLRRPPRLPANVEVPKAKVLNVVPGPRTGDTFTLSASLLRVGVTSELRIDVKREKQSGEWRVTDVLG